MVTKQTDFKIGDKSLEFMDIQDHQVPYRPCHSAGCLLHNVLLYSAFPTGSPTPMMNS